MTLPLIAILLWTICITLLYRLLQFFYKETTWHIAEKIIWPILLLLSIILLFRPHEDIYGGQDPGSYLNSAISYSRHGILIYTDPLLSKVPSEQRSLFLYGHSRFRQTKAACLWIKDIDTATVGPWFQPAYPILMSIIAKISPQLILYVIPFFTILMGIVMACLAKLIFSGRWIGMVAFLLYILNPNTIWHGRSPRPAVIASFLIIGGWTLFLKSIDKEKKRNFINILIASLAIACAPFFHITAWFVIIPLSIWVLIMCIRGHTAFLIYPPIMITSIILIYLQSIYITDCYGIGSAIHQLPISPVLLFILAACAIMIFRAVIIYRCSAGRLDQQLAETANTTFIIRITSLILATLGIIIFIAAYIGWIEPNKSLFKQCSLLANLRVTDIPKFVILVSRPVALLGLIGWGILLLKKDSNLTNRLSTTLILFPAAMSIGIIPHLMYYSRYMQPFLIPLFVLCLTAIIAIIPQKKYTYNIATPILLTLMLLLTVHNRTILYKLTEHKGFINSLTPIAKEIKNNNGILLCEYSRISAPFDHFFGIPTLGIDNKRQAGNYQEIAEAWKKVIKANPNKPAYFLTPFNSDMTNHLKMTHIKTYNYQGKKIITSKALPSKVKKYSLHLQLYSINSQMQ